MTNLAKKPWPTVDDVDIRGRIKCYSTALKKFVLRCPIDVREQRDTLLQFEPGATELEEGSPTPENKEAITAEKIMTLKKAELKVVLSDKGLNPTLPEGTLNECRKFVITSLDIK